MSEEILNQILLEVKATRTELNYLKIEVKDLSAEFEEFKEESRLYWEQNEKRWEENEKRWNQNEKCWEENEKRWNQNEKCWEENEKRWENNGITLANFRKSIKNDMDKLFEAIENIAGKNENETSERKNDVSKIDGRLKLHSIRLNTLEKNASK